MKKTIFLMIIAATLSSCMLRTHKEDVVQGNIITQEDISRLHRGMTTTDVKMIMGNPVLTNIFSGNRMEYVYYIRPAYQKPLVTRISCVFAGGRLQEIIRS